MIYSSLVWPSSENREYYCCTNIQRMLFISEKIIILLIDNLVTKYPFLLNKVIVLFILDEIIIIHFDNISTNIPFVMNSLIIVILYYFVIIVI